jgi:hypothetical protein
MKPQHGSIQVRDTTQTTPIKLQRSKIQKQHILESNMSECPNNCDNTRETPTRKEKEREI